MDGMMYVHTVECGNRRALSAPLGPLTTIRLRERKMAEKKCTKCRETKPAEIFGSHICYCKPCYSAWKRAWRKANPQLVRGQEERAKQRDPLQRSRYDKASYERHRAKRIAKSRRWNINNKESFAQREASRRATQKNATPKWSDRERVVEFYRRAAELTKQTGIKHDVDHIVPLQSPVVCGLHCEANLQVLPKATNVSKGNRRWPDMP
jgi:hypothetical protein